MTEFLVLLLGSALVSASPLILAGLGEMLLERSGAGFNLGIEGMLLLGALAGVLGSAFAGPWFGMLVGMAVGTCCGFVYAAGTAYGVDVVLVGIAISILGTGTSSYAFQIIAPAGHANISAPLLPTVRIPGLADLPGLGAPFRAVGAGLLFALGAATVIAWTLRSTRFGLRLRAAADLGAATLRGISAQKYRLVAALLAGALTGAAGAVLVLGTIGIFTPLMSGGRGFLVLAVVIIGRRTTGGVVAGALLFAGLDGLALLAQTRDLGLPSEAYHTLPYLTALVVLCTHARWLTRRPDKVVQPAGPGPASVAGLGQNQTELPLGDDDVRRPTV
ncbi:ABC transporter permease [Amycolatopsis sp. OK19-0408]|uniref:ABC transporter permease n=1 Tax=Amycolatopsis iheyensis TaxID=2945988 RepID=A0A9X2NI84_9PSEU|nr:ABC transporter permease [Amycolatopsis iheyensis]MCR6488262.1 ABC transporter permease [Amycolatopsis iheyensis]